MLRTIQSVIRWQKPLRHWEGYKYEQQQQQQQQSFIRLQVGNR